MNWGKLIAGSGGVVVLSVLASSSLAQPEPGFVAGTGSCPSPGLVSSIVRTLVHNADASLLAPATVEDRGDRFIVTFDAAVKEYSDPARRCEERAKIAASLIALRVGLAVNSGQPRPEFSSTPSPPTTASSVPPLPSASSVAPRVGPSGRWGEIDVFGALTNPSESSTWLASGGLRAAMGSDAFGVHLMCGVSSPFAMPLPHHGTANLMRVPCGVGPTLHLGLGPVLLDADVGLALGALNVSGAGLPMVSSGVRMETGGRAGVSLRMRGVTFSPVVYSELAYFPRPYEVVVTSLGTVAQTPAAYFSVGFGVSWQIWSR